MDKDKAIQLLERLQDPEPYEPMLTKDAYDAIQMAIDALSADGDTISRKAAIDALGELATFTDECSEHTWMYTDDVYKAIKQLPPAQPERIKGRWIEKPHVHGVAYCSLCDYELHTNDTNFCPNCGADMREVTECLD